MTDKTKILAEIERLKMNWRLGMSAEAKYRVEAYTELIDFINSLPEEPVSKVWHDASEKSNEPEDVVIINPSDNTGEVLTRCIDVYKGRIWAYTSVLLKFDNPCKIGKNLQEEPVSKQIDFEKELYKAFGQVKDFTLGMRIAKRFYDMGKNSQGPVSDDLGEYIDKLSKQFPEVSFAKLSRIAVRVAKWQKGQMMAKAIDAHVNYAWSGLSFGGFDWSKTGLDLGDKCKLIIIKED